MRVPLAFCGGLFCAADGAFLSLALRCVAGLIRGVAAVVLGCDVSLVSAGVTMGACVCPPHAVAVGRLAGVSIATVSRAIRMPENVAESTRKKVMAAIARTGYTANAMAQNLRMQRSQMVMVLTQSISDPNFPGILTGLEKVANSRD